MEKIDASSGDSRVAKISWIFRPRLYFSLNDHPQRSVKEIASMNRRALARSVFVAFVLVGFLGFLHMQGGGGGGGGTQAASLQVAITDSPAFRDFSSVTSKSQRSW